MVITTYTPIYNNNPIRRGISTKHSSDQLGMIILYSLCREIYNVSIYIMLIITIPYEILPPLTNTSNFLSWHVYSSLLTTLCTKEPNQNFLYHGYELNKDVPYQHRHKLHKVPRIYYGERSELDLILGLTFGGTSKLKISRVQGTIVDHRVRTCFRL